MELLFLIVGIAAAGVVLIWIYLEYNLHRINKKAQEMIKIQNAIKRQENLDAERRDKEK